MSDFVSSGTTTTKTSSDIEIDGVPMPGLKLNGLTVTKEKIWSKNTGRAATVSYTHLDVYKRQIQGTVPH